jgi:putative nucleotidyltransferase with HDIG domain
VGRHEAPAGADRGTGRPSNGSPAPRVDQGWRRKQRLDRVSDRVRLASAGHGWPRHTCAPATPGGHSWPDAFVDPQPHRDGWRSVLDVHAPSDAVLGRPSGPSVVWAYDLCESVLSEPRPRRWRHCLGVARQAVTLAELVGGDAELLEEAAVLHDIGYAPDLVQTGFHAIDAARYLRDVVGAGPRLVNLVAHHSCPAIGAGIRGLNEAMAEFHGTRR